MPNDPKWYAEQMVHDRLEPRGFQVFLPRVQTWSRHGARRQRLSSPMFPGYLFLRHPMDNASRVEVLKSRGLVRIGERWYRLSTILDDEIDVLRTIAVGGLPALPRSVAVEIDCTLAAAA